MYGRWARGLGHGGDGPSGGTLPGSHAAGSKSGGCLAVVGDGSGEAGAAEEGRFSLSFTFTFTFTLAAAAAAIFTACSITAGSITVSPAACRLLHSAIPTLRTKHYTENQTANQPHYEPNKRLS